MKEILLCPLFGLLKGICTFNSGQSVCKYPKPDKLAAFSLVEMLMALLVASLLLAALAPVMTKKFTENINVEGTVSTNNGNETHGVQIFEYDPINDSDKEYSKYSFKVPSGVHTINLVLQAGGGGGGGSSSGYSAYNNILQTSNTVDTQTIKIEDDLIGIKNLRVDLTGGGGGGGGGQSTVIDCWDPQYHKYISPTYGDGVQQCVNKFNIGNEGGPAIASGAIKCIQGVSDNTCLTCADTTSKNYGKCYFIADYSDCGIDPQGGWTGCGRTMVQYYVADAACQAYTGAKVAKGKWRIIQKADATLWYKYRYTINHSQGANGLQKCSGNPDVADGSATAPMAYCLGNYKDSVRMLCYGSQDNDCDTNRVMLSDPQGSSSTLICNLDNNLGINCASEDMSKADAVSARCLTTDNGAFTFAYKTGGGGGSGARVYNYTLPEEYNGKKLLAEGNSITITRGNYGAGGSGAGVDGSGGSPTCLTVKDSGGTSIFYLCANGGNAGKGASTSSYGAAGSAVSTCRLGTSSSSYSSVSCSSIGNGATVVSKAGSNGVNNSSASYNTTVSGGAGGVSTYNTSLPGGSGGSGIATKNVAQNTINGKAPQVSGSNVPYGAGGGGGSSGRGADSTATIFGNGGNGYVGYARITYDVERTGGSGGGGGGGSMIAVSSLEVTAGETYEIIAGKGGAGGNVNADGSSGHLSSFKYSSTNSIITNPGTGGKGGSNAGTYGIGGENGKGGNTVKPSIGYGIKMTKGTDGIKGYDYDFNPETNEGTRKSVGGNGGKSGIGTDGGCGGLTYYLEDSTDENNVNTCKITNRMGDSALYLLNTLMMGTDYGKAGSGGGGGGFESFSLQGIGGSGGNGYVYVKW